LLSANFDFYIHKPRGNSMMLARMAFLLSVPTAMVMVAATISSAPAEQHGQAVAQPEDRQRSLQYFGRIATVIEHPRCMNCHTSTDFPRQGDDGHPHIMQVRRGLHDSGTPALQCNTCHQRENSPSGVPGNEVWHLAPLRMAWEGLSTGDICRSLTDPQKGGMSYEQLIHHMAEDKLVAWAWDPGVDLSGKPRSMPPVSHSDFGQLVRDWVATGAACPS
jgi:hypothetical protein